MTEVKKVEGPKVAQEGTKTKLISGDDLVHPVKTVKVILDEKSLNFRALPFPTDPSGRTAKLREALGELANVQDLAVAKRVLEVLRLAIDWHPARVMQNRKEVADKNKMRAAQLDEQARLVAARQLEEAKRALSKTQGDVAAKVARVKALEVASK